MISKTDCIIILSDMEDKGIDTTEAVKQLTSTETSLLDVIKFINEYRQLDVTAFYENLRRNYNKKHSNLYINIVKEINEPVEVLTTLASLQLQILLYARKVQDKTMFLKHSRAEEISKVLTNYYHTYDITLAQKLIRLIKCDIKALELTKS